MRTDSLQAPNVARDDVAAETNQSFMVADAGDVPPTNNLASNDIEDDTQESKANESSKVDNNPEDYRRIVDDSR